MQQRLAAISVSLVKSLALAVLFVGKGSFPFVSASLLVAGMKYPHSYVFLFSAGSIRFISSV